MSHVDYYECDRCGRKGEEKFSHIDMHGRHSGRYDLCQHCALEIKSFMAAVRAGRGDE